MKHILLKAVVLSGVLLVTGCGFKQPNLNVHLEDDRPAFRLESGDARADTKRYTTAEEQAACSIHFHLYSAARVTLDQGYKYFAIVDNRKDIAYESNLNGLAINTSEAYMRYCNPELSEKDTGLEDDKCQFHYLGRDISKKWGGQVLMLKKRTYLFPTWDAQKVMREEGAKANVCIDWSKYSNATSVSDAKIKY